MRPFYDDWFAISADIAVSPVFLSWMFGFGSLAMIKEPDTLITAMKELLEQNREHYPDR
ncbi:WYL domain-containing protein [Eubacteriales bacterium OttesenSCG-928-K08]|nr:WYL domain-containing protein [Eubacteriales bacterium OttesenSCG-928-K08]